MKQLMIHVERAVRPVCAEESTKCNMREELYAHITSICEQELEQTDDKEAAISQACRRFGQPADLTPELQQSVSWLGRAVASIDRWVWRRKHETILHYAWRIVATSVLFFTILSVVTLGGFHVLGVAGIGPSANQVPHGFALRIRFVFALGCWFVANVAVFTLISHAMCRQLETGLLRPRSWRVTSGLCVLAALTVLGTGWGFLLIVPIDFGESLTLLPRWLVLACLTPLGFAALARLAAIEVVRSRPWDSLILDD